VTHAQKISFHTNPVQDPGILLTVFEMTPELFTPVFLKTTISMINGSLGIISVKFFEKRNRPCTGSCSNAVKKYLPPATY
jgi:hypothetical protein